MLQIFKRYMVKLILQLLSATVFLLETTENSSFRLYEKTPFRTTKNSSFRVRKKVPSELW